MKVDLRELKKKIEGEIEVLEERRRQLREQIKQVDMVEEIARRLEVSDPVESAVAELKKANGAAEGPAEAPKPADPSLEWAFQS